MDFIMHRFVTMKILVFSFVLLIISFAVNAQIDSIEYVEFIDKSGNWKKALVVKVEQILVVDGDSIYTVSNEFQLQKIIQNYEDVKFISIRDSINAFLQNRIKSLVILKGMKKD